MTKNDTEIDPLAARQQKLERLRQAKIDPFPATAVPHTPLAEVLTYAKKHCPLPESSSAKLFTVAGRLRAIRGQGKIVFLDLADIDNRLQIVAKADILGPEQDLIPLLDIGDFIWVSGNTFRTKRGELSILARDLKLLTKSLRPLPDKWSGLKDQETRYRQRYVDLVVNDQVRQLFQTRSQFIQNWRVALDEYKFLEVETPVLEHIPGGADAEPFMTKHHTLDIDLYLRISLELHLKRVMVGGLERVFEIGRVFRNEGMSPQHLQEFTMLELYWAYNDYVTLMELVERLYAKVIKETFGSTKIKRSSKPDLDFTPPWPRTSYVEAVKKHTGIDVTTASDSEIETAVKQFVGEPAVGRARQIDQLYKKTTRPKLDKIQFLVDPPLVLSPLAKPHLDNPLLAERFWVLVDGAEVGNGFSELNDPLDQRERFAAQEKLRQAGDVEAQRLDEDYIRALEYGMPPAAGFGVGIDRLLAIITNQESIRDVVLFPTMRPEK